MNRLRSGGIVAAAALAATATLAPAPPDRSASSTDRVALAAAEGPEPSSAGDPGAEDGLDRYRNQPLTWQDCALGPDDEPGGALDAAGARCAEITVPLDYEDPHGATLTVAFSRLRTGDAEQTDALGPLLLNGGGPGGPSLDLPLSVADAMGDVSDRYDLIGMDPRFVGRSTPLDCGWDTGSFLRSSGPDRASYLANAAFQRDLAERCQESHAAVLPYATTRDTARDMDLIREVLDAERLHYLGYSYGSYLGQVYSQLYPATTGRMVLDGVLDPDSYSVQPVRGATAANERALADWAAWAAARHDRYGLGTTRDAVLDRVHEVLRAADERPLRVGEHQVDGGVAPLIIFDGLGSEQDEARDVLASAVAVLARAADGGHPEPTPHLAEALDFFGTGSFSAYGSAQAAILCGDAPARGTVRSHWREIRQARATHPFAAPVTLNITPCSFWDAPREQLTDVDTDVPALLVTSTGDPRTTYEDALAVRELWPSSRLLTLEGVNEHAIYGEYGSDCVDHRVNSYLDTGQLPADTSCPPLTDG